MTVGQLPRKLEAGGLKLDVQHPASSIQFLDLRHPNGRKVRIDALPEHLEYRDTGCDLAPSCLRCPLERCRYDEPGGARKLLQGSRDEAVVRRREEGIAIDALAREFDLSRRTVFRILARGRAASRLEARSARREAGTLGGVASSYNAA